MHGPSWTRDYSVPSLCARGTRSLLVARSRAKSHSQQTCVRARAACTCFPISDVHARGCGVWEASEEGSGRRRGAGRPRGGRSEGYERAQCVADCETRKRSARARGVGYRVGASDMFQDLVQLPPPQPTTSRRPRTTSQSIDCPLPAHCTLLSRPRLMDTCATSSHARSPTYTLPICETLLAILSSAPSINARHVSQKRKGRREGKGGERQAVSCKNA